MGFFDDIAGGNTTVRGISPDTSERGQRYNFEESAYLGGSAKLAQDELFRLEITGRLPRPNFIL